MIGSLATSAMTANATVTAYGYCNPNLAGRADRYFVLLR